MALTELDTLSTKTGQDSIDQLTTMTVSKQPPTDHVFDPGDMASLAYQTNIDRRYCTRTVPLRVLCLGT